jgi:hypothetical protein
VQDKASLIVNPTIHGTSIQYHSRGNVQISLPDYQKNFAPQYFTGSWVTSSLTDILIIPGQRLRGMGTGEGT